MCQYQLFKRVSFRVHGEEVVTRRSMIPLIETFKQKLKMFKFEEGTFTAWIEGEPDDLQVNFVEPNMASCSLRISLEMRDAKYDGSAERFNQFGMTILANRLKDLNIVTNKMALEFVKC